MKEHTEYRTCPYCGANNDPDERCDCFDKKLEEPTPPVSETLLVSVDIAGGDEIACLSVYRQKGKHLTQVNVFYGGEARKLYDKLQNTEPVEMATLYAEGLPYVQVPIKQPVVDNLFVDERLRQRLRGYDAYPVPDYDPDNIDSDMIGWASKENEEKKRKNGCI